MSDIYLPNEILSDFGGIAVVFIIFYLFVGFTGLVFYILQAVGVYKMGKSLELSNPWICFIPIVSVFALGRIAQKYVKRDGTASAKFSIILLILYIVMLIAAIALVVFAAVAVISITAYANQAIADDSSMGLELFTSVIPLIICYFITLACAIAYNIIYYVALWRVFSIFNNNNATLFTVLSVFFSFLCPIFLFAIRNKEPKLTYSQRMGFEEI